MPSPVLFRAHDLIRMKSGEEVRDAWAKFQADGFEGPDWDAFRGALCGGALEEVLAAGMAGLVRRAAVDRKVPTGWLVGLRIDEHEFEDFAYEACEKHLVRFTEQVKAGSSKAWRPEAGATPLTYLLCDLYERLPNLVRSYRRAHKHTDEEVLTDLLDSCNGPSAQSDPWPLADLQRLADELLARTDPQTAMGWRLWQAGFSDSEIAERLEISVDRVRTDRYAFQGKNRKERGME